MSARALLPLLWLLTACPPPATVVDKPKPEVSYAEEAGLPGTVAVAFDLPRDEAADLFSMPWPSEIRRTADGRINLRGFPAREHFIVANAFDEAEPRILGYSVAPVVYFRFSGPVDEELLAQAITSKSIRLLDVDPVSPERGRSQPLRSRYHGTPQRYVPEHTLALRPRYPLREGTLHAVVIPRALGSLKMGTAAAFEHIKHTAPRRDPVEERARALHEGTFAWLHEQGMPREEVGAIALFRTQAASSDGRALIETADALPAAHRPRILSAEWLHIWDTSSYRVIRGYYCTPSFQTGLRHAPFIQRGGLIEHDGAGRPRPYSIPEGDDDYEPDCGGNMRARFVLSLPQTDMPKRGWPLLVYGHGTTGNAFNVLGMDSFAGRAAAAGMAAVSTDQPLHGSDDPEGARPGSDKAIAFKLGPIPIPLPTAGKGGELAFYNLLRPLVVRDNLTQATVDAALLARLMLATDFATATRPDGSPVLGVLDLPAPRFDRDFGYVVSGHSQGSQSAAALGAVDPLARGVLLSACGGDYTSHALTREDAQTPKQLLGTVLGLEPGELDEFHPLVTLAQTILDPVDPQSFGFLYQSPGTRPPRSVLMVNGEGDTMTVDRSSAILAASMGAVPLAPLPRAIPELDALGLAAKESVRANGAGGRATLALLQLAPSYAYDGHYVAYYEVVAHRTIEAFLRALLGQEHPPTISRSE